MNLIKLLLNLIRPSLINNWALIVKLLSVICVNQTVKIICSTKQIWKLELLEKSELLWLTIKDTTMTFVTSVRLNQLVRIRFTFLKAIWEFELVKSKNPLFSTSLKWVISLLKSKLNHLQLLKNSFKKNLSHLFYPRLFLHKKSWLLKQPRKKFKTKMSGVS